MHSAAKLRLDPNLTLLAMLQVARRPSDHSGHRSTPEMTHCSSWVRSVGLCFASPKQRTLDSTTRRWRNLDVEAIRAPDSYVALTPQFRRVHLSQQESFGRWMLETANLREAFPAVVGLTPGCSLGCSLPSGS
jgi:hypothetical protein